MAGQRSRIKRTVLMDGAPLGKELEDFSPPEIKKKMEEIRGGHFLASEIMVGLEVLKSKLTIKGATPVVLKAMGVKQGERAQLDVIETHQDEDGVPAVKRYSLNGEVISLVEANTKVGELGQIELEMTLSAAELTENGTRIYKVDRDADIFDLGQGDLLEKHRAEVLG